MTSATDRPTGVTILAVVAGITGVVDILAGLGDIGIAGGFLSDHGFGDTLDGIMTVVGLALVAIGVLGLATGFGLWRGRNWAWLITRLWASVCIVVGRRGRCIVSAGRHAHELDPWRRHRLRGHGHRRRRGALVPLPAARQGDVRAHLIGATSRGPVARMPWPARAGI